MLYPLQRFSFTAEGKKGLTFQIQEVLFRNQLRVGEVSATEYIS
jgi:hypothetical protein